MHFGGHQSLCLLNLLFKVKKYPQAGEILKIFESDN